MSSQNRFLLPASSGSSVSSTSKPTDQASNHDDQENQLSVDTDFDSYWEEEARNPHRNRIRIGRQYQATVPPLLKLGEKDQRKLEELEVLSFCPKRSARVTDAELDHYFTVAKSLNLFASLVETRSLLGRDVTIADLNHIRRKEGLSLASVIQPSRQAANYNISSNLSHHQTASSISQTNQQSPQKSPPTNSDKVSSSVAASPKEAASASNQPLMKALSHFISLHHPCHHDSNCKKLQKDIPLEDDSRPSVSITADNLRQASSSNTKDFKTGRSRSSIKQASHSKDDQGNQEKDQDEHHSRGDNVQSPSFEDWTREEVELFSKAIEVCGKNFSSIKKEFLPSKSVKSIVEYYYIGCRDFSDIKKKSNQAVDAGDGCSSPEKTTANNNGQGGGGGGSGTSVIGKSGNNATAVGSTSSTSTSTSRNSTTNKESSSPNKNSTDTGELANQVFKNEVNTKQSKLGPNDNKIVQNSNPRVTDPRMSVYNFDDEFKEDSPVNLESSKLGAEVKPLKAKPIIPKAFNDSDNNNPNVGSLKFFMDGQLVLKLNACQDQQQGAEKCHWVQSGERNTGANRQKRYSKRREKNLETNQNGSQSDSVVSSYHDDDSKNDDLTGDEDSKESMNYITNNSAPIKANNNISSPESKRFRATNESNISQGQQSSPVDYNRLALNNRMKERNDMNSNPAITQAMPWLQANSFAMAAALLGGLPFPQPTPNIIQDNQNSINTLNSKPMDLSVEHHSPPKPFPKVSGRSKNRSKNT